MTATTTLSAGNVRRMPVRRQRRQDDVTADFLAMVVKPGDRTIQIGASDLGTVCLQRGARHEVVAPISAIEALQAACDRRSIPTDALRGGVKARSGADERPIDVAIFGADSGFPAMAGNWRHVAASMRTGGVLVLLGADHGASARLADALMKDPAWTLQERVCGDAAIFRKVNPADSGRTLELLSEAARPNRRPRGVARGPFAALAARIFPQRAAG
jgi:hypothetical protein